MIEIKELITQHHESFSKEIYRIAHEDNLTITEAIIAYCQERDIDVLEVVDSIDDTIKEHLRVEGIMNNAVVGKRGKKLI